MQSAVEYSVKNTGKRLSDLVHLKASREYPCEL